MSETGNLPEDAQGQQPEPDDDTQDFTAPDTSDSTVGAGTTEGADSFGPTDVETDFEGSDTGAVGSDAGTTSEGESDSAFGGETGEFGSDRDSTATTTDGNTSAGDAAEGAAGDVENG